MKLSDFNYELPESLIAKMPAQKRSASRLLVADSVTKAVSHKRFSDLVDYLHPGDVLVLNESRVIPARLFGEKPSGGKVEILIERFKDAQTILAHVRVNKTLRAGGQVVLGSGDVLEMLGREADLFVLKLLGDKDLLSVVEAVGHIPLPPYIDRADNAFDVERYQTVYAKQKGSVAAPTAGLHFDAALLDAIEAKGVKIVKVTLHVGAGTFAPVRVDDIRDHHMHQEFIEVDQAVCDAVNEAKALGNRVIAVGTTSVRCLETAAASGDINPFVGDTNIFIYPGYTFQCVDAMVTNFHLPKSTLLMLISAFAGRDFILSAYQEAIDHAYRFFSYGDAMFLTAQSSKRCE
jgi:S-adenosylmethionine:tRNA ribosyltransferase-isomerase